MIKHILFDLDGTLTDPKEGIINSVRYALRAYMDAVPAADELMGFIGPPLQDSFMDFLGVDRAEAVRAVEIYREYFADKGIYENRAMDGMTDLLERLKASGRTLAVATSKPQIFAERVIKQYGMEPYFEVLVGSELDGRRTRKSEVILEAMRLLGAKTAVMVGDRRHDIIGAKEAGIPSVGVRFGYADEGELEAAGADYIAATVEELGDILLSL